MSIETLGRRIVRLDQLSNKERTFIADSCADPKDVDSVTLLVNNFEAEFSVKVLYDTMRRMLTNLLRKKRRGKSNGRPETTTVRRRKDVRDLRRSATKNINPF